MIVLGLLLLLAVALAVWAMLARELIVAAIGLALVSAVLACALFALQMPLAGVFELSVCAGLITVVFVSAISLTQPESGRPAARGTLLSRIRLVAGLLLLLLMLAATVALLYLGPGLAALPAPAVAAGDGVRQVLWGERRLDLVGQIAAILAGALGVVVLFKYRRARPAGESADAEGRDE